MQAPSTSVDIEDQDGVLVLLLNHPPANALNRALVVALAGLFKDLASLQDPPPVVLTGQGDRFFCAGGDIKELAGEQEELDTRMREFHSMLVAIETYPRPVIGAINGHCVGGGMEIALLAEVVFAVPGARFGFPEINHGLLPADKGIQRASRLLGLRTARQLLLSGDLIDADHAQAIGLVDELVEPTLLIDAAIASAREAGSKAPVLFAALKRSLNDSVTERDEASFRRTLSAAFDSFGDPAAHNLRANWNSSRSQRDAR